MFPEVLQEGEEKGERKLENLGNGGNAIFRKRHAKVLLDGTEEHIVRLEQKERRFDRIHAEGDAISLLLLQTRRGFPRCNL